ncbi:MAG: putative DNA-binding domain-containing protein, partial [Thermomicrobiales bacterium]
MKELRELQREFADALFDAARAPPRDVTSYTAARPTRRFDVYRNNVFASFSDILEAYFPVVTRLVGVEFFRFMVREFVLNDPPRSPVLSRLGMRFPDFIRSIEKVHELPYLADVATLELMQQRAYHASDRTPVTAGDLAAIPHESAGDVVLELLPSANLFMSPYPAVSIWRTNTFDAVVKPLSLAAGGDAALIVRPQLEVSVIPIPNGTEHFVASLMRGHTLRQA